MDAAPAPIQIVSKVCPVAMLGWQSLKPRGLQRPLPHQRPVAGRCFRVVADQRKELSVFADPVCAGKGTMPSCTCRLIPAFPQASMKGTKTFSEVSYLPQQSSGISNRPWSFSRMYTGSSDFALKWSHRRAEETRVARWNYSSECRMEIID